MQILGIAYRLFTYYKHQMLNFFRMKWCELVCMFNWHYAIQNFMQSSDYSAHSSSVAPTVCCILCFTPTHTSYWFSNNSHACMGVYDVVWVGGGRTSCWIVCVSLGGRHIVVVIQEIIVSICKAFVCMCECWVRGFNFGMS